jgi:hypothetical protein
MAIAFDNIASNTTPATTLSINPGAAAGSTIIAVVCNDSASSVTFTWPSGFTELLNQLCASSDGGSVGIAIKNSASGSEGSLDITSSQAMIGYMVSFSGCDTTTPLDITPPAAVVNTTQTAPPLVIDTNTITPVTNGAMIFGVRMTDVGASESKPCTFSTLSGTTGSWNSPARDYNSGFYNVNGGWAPQTTAGSVVVRTSTSGAANAAGVAWGLALRPAGAGGSGAGRLVEGNLVNGSLIGSLAA